MTGFMFFWASKILWAFVAPANLAVILLAAGAVCAAVRRRRAGAVFGGLAFAVLLVFGVLPTGTNMLVWLERSGAAAQPAELPAKIDGVIVLGGMFETRLYDSARGPEINDHADRILKGMEIARAHPESLLLLTGGSGFLTRNDRTEDMDAEEFLTRQGFPPDSVFFENESRNTAENIFLSKAMMDPQPGEAWVLVTSAYHMKRALGIAAKAEWDVIPMAVDPRTDGQYRVFPSRFDVQGELYRSTIAIKEIMGLYVYRLTGRAA